MRLLLALFIAVCCIMGIVAGPSWGRSAISIELPGTLVLMEPNIESAVVAVDCAHGVEAEHPGFSIQQYSSEGLPVGAVLLDLLVGRREAGTDKSFLTGAVAPTHVRSLPDGTLEVHEDRRLHLLGPDQAWQVIDKVLSYTCVSTDSSRILQYDDFDCYWAEVLDAAGNTIWHSLPRDMVTGAGLAADGSFFLTVDADTVRMFDRDGRLQWTAVLPGNPDEWLDPEVCVSTEGSAVIYTGGRMCRVSSDGQLRWDRPYCVDKVFLPAKGHGVICGNGDEVMWLDAGTGAVVHTLLDTTLIDVSPSGALLCSRTLSDNEAQVLLATSDGSTVYTSPHLTGTVVGGFFAGGTSAAFGAVGGSSIYIYQLQGQEP